MSKSLQTLIDENPALVFYNDGYEELPRAVVEAHKDAIAQIEAILKARIKGFARFQNFKPRKDGSIAVRYQVAYSDHFTGVAYTPLEEI